MRPKPWSFTSLEDFVNCPKAYHAKRIAKTVTDPPTPHTIWGNYVHKQFELNQKDGTPLDPQLAEHQPLMDELRRFEGFAFTERKVALSTQLRPCGQFDKDVWWRGVIDWGCIHPSGTTARLVDYKTGKPSVKYRQLMLFALYMFIEQPNLQEIHTEYYWLQTKERKGTLYLRHQVPMFWRAFAADLRQYVHAFKTDTWQARPSGLCNGWCPLQSCQHWRPKRTT